MTPESKTPSTGRAAVAVAISACCFGAIPVLVSLAIATGAALSTLLTYRYLVAAAVFVVLLAVAREPMAQPRRAGSLILFGGVGQFLVAFLGLSALRYIPVANATFLFYTFPAWVAIIAALRKTEPLTRVRVAALGLSLAGITVMIGGSTTAAGNPRGVALALSAAVVYSLYIPAMERLQQGLGSRTAALLVCLGAGASFLLLSTIDGSMTTSLHRTAWLAILVLAVVSTVAAFQLFLSGLKVLGPVRTAIVSTVEPFSAALLGAWLLSQALTAATIAGGLLIIGAVILLQRASRTVAVA